MQVQRLFEIVEYQLANFPQKACVESYEDGKLRAYSTKEFIETAESLALGLMTIGIVPGDKVAMVSGNRAEWAIVDQALLRIGAINIPIYPTSSADDYAYVLNHSESKVFFVSNPELLAKATEAKKNCPGLEHIFSFEKIQGTPNWKELLGKGEDGRAKLDTYKAQVKRADLATIIYTSGTTGRPKGVMLSHDNILSNVEASTPRLPISAGSRAISFLPLCHIYERMLMYLYQRAGTQVRFQETLEDLGARIREAEPDVFTAVPRLLEKIYDSILAKGEALTGIKRKLFFWSLELGEAYDVHGRSAWYDFQLSIARKLVFSKWKAGLGGKVKVIASGSAALQPRLARIFNAAGIPLMEGYGLTETSPVVSVNDAQNDGLRFGSVGKPLDNVQVRIASDGEILIKGPNVMMGYYKEPEMTAEVLSPDGWFSTGDIGELSEDGFLRITDRKKEMFKTSGGKYVAPQLIENKLKESRFIEQVMVIGENRKFPSALIVPSFAFLKDYCKLKGIPFTSNEQIVNEKRIIDRIDQEVDKVNASLGHWEQVKRVALLATEWGIDSGEMTPKLSLRRKPILAKYSKEVKAIYGEA
ncbi:MAG: long-chain fatty acid--CoA ligase [Flavobacteriales bacterium]|nr:long-chain fatty acid--CoA ligase [Flavobacteriales bacterium]MBK6946327.1 long-chain fatty acid--CoA ligase [Flavobacteriales bacterium]MBK7238721.1 long-chain fatty acid--CoA ligase [Flavobacteriales bacterium]MBK7297710.1 long-chain fatty acid--CoA ligase [Flavobacteriales bacterium]MBK9536377.1 long-chain fatty acid--CoA ligase [Flavobacteriales bacterium]